MRVSGGGGAFRRCVDERCASGDLLPEAHCYRASECPPRVTHGPCLQAGDGWLNVSSRSSTQAAADSVRHMCACAADERGAFLFHRERTQPAAELYADCRGKAYGDTVSGCRETAPDRTWRPPVSILCAQGVIPGRRPPMCLPHRCLAPTKDLLSPENGRASGRRQLGGE